MDFTKQGVAGTLDFLAVEINDIHHRPGAVTYDATYSRFIASVLGSDATKILIGGDVNHVGAGSVPNCVAMRDALIAKVGAANYLPCIGNHDSLLTLADLGFPAGVTENYYSADMGTNWRLIALYTGPDYGNYELGATQWAWLQAELASAAAAGKYVFIMGHVPFLVQGIMSFWLLDDHLTKAQSITGISADTLLEMEQIFILLNQYPNVKGWISGHQHSRDIAIINGVTYINGGAVAGNWWSASLNNMIGGIWRPNYNQIRFNKDGTFFHSFVEW